MPGTMGGCPGCQFVREVLPQLRPLPLRERRIGLTGEATGHGRWLRVERSHHDVAAAEDVGMGSEERVERIEIDGWGQDDVKLHPLPEVALVEAAKEIDGPPNRLERAAAITGAAVAVVHLLGAVETDRQSKIGLDQKAGGGLVDPCAVAGHAEVNPLAHPGARLGDNRAQQPQPQKRLAAVKTDRELPPLRVVQVPSDRLLGDSGRHLPLAVRAVMRICTRVRAIRASEIAGFGDVEDQLVRSLCQQMGDLALGFVAGEAADPVRALAQKPFLACRRDRVPRARQLIGVTSSPRRLGCRFTLQHPGDSRLHGENAVRRRIVNVALPLGRKRTPQRHYVPPFAPFHDIRPMWGI